MTDAWEIKRYNRGINQFFNVKEADGSTIKNISGYTVTLKVWSSKSDLLLSGTCTVCSGDLGTCYYTVTSGSFPSPKRYWFELELVKGTELIDTDTYTLNVKETAPI